MSIKRPYLLTISLLSLTALSAIALSSTVSATDNTDAVDNVSIGVPISCSLEGTGMTSHNASIPNGTYTADIGSTTLKAYCNDDEGFAIFAAGYTGDEIGGTNSTKLVGTNGNIVTGTATSGSTSNWAMKLATNSGATYPITLDNSFGSYSAVPASYTKVAHRDSGTDIGTGATGASLTTTYAAFVSQTQPAGTYSGKVIYTLVHPSNEAPIQPIACEGYKICYNPNTATALGQMGKQSVSNNASATLWASNFSRSGYGFAGWNTEYDYSGTYYGPNQTITTPTNTYNKGLPLYAVWVPSAGVLQNWSGCSGLNIGDVTALTDSRDNETYAVAKLADGNCWMIENFRLENTASHNSDGSLAQGYHATRFIGLANPENYTTFGTTTANSLYSTDGSTTATISGSKADCRFPRYNNHNTSSRQSDPSNYSESNNTYSYGNYYTWTAAIADTGYYVDVNHNTTSICPKGWRIPTGDDSGEYETLINAINAGGSSADANKKLRTYPNNFVFSGSLSPSTGAWSLGYSGSYWSSTASVIRQTDWLTAWNLSVESGDVVDSAQRSGKPIRCIINP